MKFTTTTMFFTKLGIEGMNMSHQMNRRSGWHGKVNKVQKKKKAAAGGGCLPSSQFTGHSGVQCSVGGTQQVRGCPVGR